jgi:hypothetical protein
MPSASSATWPAAEAFGLALHEDKTRLIEFGRFAHANRSRRGQGKPETFDFLGFTHCCGKSSKGQVHGLEADQCQTAAGQVHAVKTNCEGACTDRLPSRASTCER